jgi:rubredoxin
VGRGPAMPREDPYELAVASDEYFCPVCGIGLAQSDFEKPEKDYYCPYCSTRQTPSVL